MPEVHASLAKMRNFVEGVQGGRIHGATGKTFTDIVNIGIGGSDLGIVMATEALAKYRNRNMRLHCVSNIDGVQLGDVLEKADPARTLFVVCSKTFTTLETLTNAKLARQWIVDRLGEGAPARHFAAVSTNAKAMDAFLIPPQNRFTMWDWVGGRYSVWSAVGLSVALALGMDQFELMLEGGHEMDEHFASAPFEQNLPVLMGLIGVWNRNFLGIDSLAVLPYDQRLHRFPAYLQQLEMESNGKRTTLGGAPRRLRHRCGALGRAGVERAALVLPAAAPGHRASVALDFLAPVNASSPYQQQQNLALANCFAQAQAFAFGQTEQQVRADLAAQGPGGERDRAADAAQGASRQSAELGPAVPAPRPEDARPADRAVRAQGVHAERDLGHQRVRSVGRGARQEAGGLPGAGGRGSAEEQRSGAAGVARAGCEVAWLKRRCAAPGREGAVGPQPRDFDRIAVGLCVNCRPSSQGLQLKRP